MSEQVVRAAMARAQVDEWALALAAVGISTRIDWHPERGYVLLVDAGDTARAAATLAAYELENRAEPPAHPPAPEHGTTYAAAVAALLLCALFFVTGPRDGRHPAFAAGAADAARIWAGEYWRAVTALVLHADFPHVLGNAVALAIFGTALCALVGPGPGLWLMVLAGAGGNLINAIVRGPPHSAIGASTAIFGGLGALAALRVAQRYRSGTPSTWRAWAPLAAGIALLGMLGSSPHSDVLAHLFGFAVGAMLGTLAARWHLVALSLPAQSALLAGLLAVVGACWLAAFWRIAG
ncbi:MAG: rhomboid family intramembrane serine protease [Candidatus Binatia bacterium]